MVETIISPAAVLASSDRFYFWTQVGCKDPDTPGKLVFTSRDGRLSMSFDLDYRGGLNYCTSDVFMPADEPHRIVCSRTVAPTPHKSRRNPHHLAPTPKARQIESELWLLRFGSPGEQQLDVLPSRSNTTHFATSISKNRPTFENSPLNERQSESQPAAQNSTWTLHSCDPPPRTTGAQ